MSAPLAPAPYVPHSLATKVALQRYHGLSRNPSLPHQPVAAGQFPAGSPMQQLLLSAYPHLAAPGSMQASPPPPLSTHQVASRSVLGKHGRESSAVQTVLQGPSQRARPYLMPWQQSFLEQLQRLIPNATAAEKEVMTQFVLDCRHELGGLLPGSGNGWLVWYQVTTALKLIEPTQRINALNKWSALKKSGQMCTINIVAKLFNDDAAFKEASKGHLKTVFDDMSDKTEAYNVAVFAADMAPELFLDPRNDDTDGINFEILANKIKSLAHPNATGRKNPYAEYQRLRAKQNLIELMEPIDLGTCRGFNFQLNLPGFRARASKVKYTSADLAPGIDPGSLKELFKDLKKRLATLSKEKQTAALTEIKKKFPKDAFKDICALEDHIFAFGKAISRLLAEKGEPGSTVSESAFYLYASLKYITDVSNKLEPNATLTAREMELIDLSSMLWECGIGQEDGVADYYSTLPREYKNSATLATVSSTEFKIESGVEAAMQSLQLKKYASEELHEALLRSSQSGSDSTSLIDIQQSAHLKTSLKNNFYRETGLLHTLKFDLGTDTLSDQYVNLLHTNPARILEMYVKTISLDDLICKVQKSVKSSMKAGLYNFGALSTYFTNAQAIVPSTHEFSLPKLIELEDDLSFKRITTLGALTILLKMGYIKVK